MSSTEARRRDILVKFQVTDNEVQDKSMTSKNDNADGTEQLFSGLEMFSLWNWKEQMMLKQQGLIR